MIIRDALAFIVKNLWVYHPVTAEKGGLLLSPCRLVDMQRLLAINCIATRSSPFVDTYVKRKHLLPFDTYTPTIETAIAISCNTIITSNLTISTGSNDIAATFPRLHLTIKLLWQRGSSLSEDPISNINTTQEGPSRQFLVVLLLA